MAGVEGVRTPFHVAARLIGAAHRDWTRLDGWAAGQGFDPLDLPLDRLCNFVYSKLAENKSEEDRERLDDQLWRPPQGVEVDDAETGVWSADSELEAFGKLATTAGSL